MPGDPGFGGAGSVGRGGTRELLWSFLYRAERLLAVAIVFGVAQECSEGDVQAGTRSIAKFQSGQHPTSVTTRDATGENNVACETQCVHEYCSHFHSLYSWICPLSIRRLRNRYQRRPSPILQTIKPLTEHPAQQRPHTAP
jgi:hypothetical protein